MKKAEYLMPPNAFAVGQYGFFWNDGDAIPAFGRLTGIVTAHLPSGTELVGYTHNDVDVESNFMPAPLDLIATLRERGAIRS